MKILIVTNMAPFVWGGAEELAKYLGRQLNNTPGVQSEILRVPFTWDPPERLLDEMFIARSLRIENVDRSHRAEISSLFDSAPPQNHLVGTSTAASL